jgi:hypothetical protein
MLCAKLFPHARFEVFGGIRISKDRLPFPEKPADFDQRACSGGYPIFLPTDGKVRGFDALDVFETCVKAAARYFAKRP